MTIFAVKTCCVSPVEAVQLLPNYFGFPQISQMFFFWIPLLLLQVTQWITKNIWDTLKFYLTFITSVNLRIMRERSMKAPPWLIWIKIFKKIIRCSVLFVYHFCNCKGYLQMTFFLRKYWKDSTNFLSLFGSINPISLSTSKMLQTDFIFNIRWKPFCKKLRGNSYYQKHYICTGWCCCC